MVCILSHFKGNSFIQSIEANRISAILDLRPTGRERVTVLTVSIVTTCRETNIVTMYIINT